MDNTTITSSNCVFTITVPGLGIPPVKLDRFSSDKAFATDAVEMAEIQMGVDGHMSAGYTPNPVKQTVSLMANSPSKTVFKLITQATKTTQEVYYISGTISLPSTGESFVLNRGVLSTSKQIPDAQKVLAPMDYIITWESVDAGLL